MKKLLVILVFFLSLCTLASCKNQIEYIKICEETIPATFEVDNVEQKLTAIVLEIGKSKGENELLNVSKSMISESDLNKLKNPGLHSIVINYEGFSANLTIEVTDPNSYSVKVVYPNGDPVTSGVTVQWCTGNVCLLPVAVGANGVAYNSIEDGDYYIHIDGIPSGYTYDPNAYTTNKNNKNVEIKLIELKSFTGDGTSANPIIVSEGAVNVTYEGAGQAYMKYYSFTPTSNGTYSIKSLAMDKLALNAIDPYIGFLGTETDMSKIDTSGNGDGKNINFTHTFTAEAGVSYTFIIFVSSASKYPASFDIVITK